MKKIRLLLFPISFLLITLLPAQDLPRRAFLGVQMRPLAADDAKTLGLPNADGVRLATVFPNSSAESAGLKQGDVLLKVGNTATRNSDEVIAALKTYRAGQKLVFEVWRDGKKRTLEGLLKTFPTTEFAGIALEYGAVRSGNALLRTLSTRPAGDAAARRPAILFIQGVSCYTLDTPFDTASSENQLLNDLTRRGYVTLRVEKPGIGDSQGGPCTQVDFTTEADIYRQALRQLRTRPDVDSANVFIIGHSMGGVFAPLLAKEIPVKGIIAFGTLGVNFMEYFTNSRRTIAQANAMPPGEADDYVRTNCDCAYRYVTEGLPAEEVARKYPACADLARDLEATRRHDFWLQLNKLNIPALWAAYDGQVLAAWGKADYISTRAEHELITGFVNQAHPGNGTFLEVPDSDHGMHMAADFQEAVNKQQVIYNPVVSRMFGEWLDKAVKAPGRRAAAPPSDRSWEVLKMDGVENAYPRLSSDGSRIVFQSNRSGKWQIYVMNRDGSGQQALTRDSFNNNFVDWSADDGKIAFVSDRDGNEEIYLMNADGSGLRRLTNHPARDIHPYFSPDGRKILFNSTRGEIASFDIFEMDLNGKVLRQITDTRDEETCARYSPDMRSIVYLRGDVALRNDEVFVMNADGSGVRNLTQSTAAEGWPTWSPDGRRIVYASTEPGTFCLYEMNADGTGKRRLTEAQRPLRDARPALSAGSDALVFNRQEGKTIGIYMLKN
jgi:pimeloyl-ACP methyl ester carboxylesterase